MFRLRATHLIDFCIIELLPSPTIPFQLLRVHLPFGQEADLESAIR